MTPALLALTALATSLAPEAHAIVVAHNRSVDETLPALRFADDDGARYFELLGLMTPHIKLLSVLDADSQALHPAAARAARAPSRAELETALQTTFEAISTARAAGRRTVFYFIYVGHGSVDDRGEGVVHLADGYFSRSDLFREVIKRSPATVNHVVIDACNAYLLVASRGNATDSIDRALDRFLTEESLTAYPNTGVLLATSQATDVHEWSRFAAGVFSHEVRSALTGAADVEGDGEVSYAEVQAFVAAANARVTHARARLQVYGRPPQIHREEPLFARSWVRSATTLSVPASMAGRYWLEDDRGVRYADFHSAPGVPVRLTLVPAETYVLRSEREQINVPAGIAQLLDASKLPREDVVVAARGGEDRAFRKHLFQLPYGPAYFEGFLASSPDDSITGTPVTPPGTSIRPWVSASLFGAAAAAVAVGVGFGLSSRGLRADYNAAVGAQSDVDSLRARANTHGTIANVAFGTAGAAAAAATAVLLWPRP